MRVFIGCDILSIWDGRKGKLKTGHDFIFSAICAFFVDFWLTDIEISYIIYLIYPLFEKILANF